MKLIRLTASLSALSVAIAGAPITHADSPNQDSSTAQSTTAQQAYQAVERADRKWTNTAADVSVSTSDKDMIGTTQQGVGISVPNDPSSKMAIEGRNGKVSVDLLFSGSTSKAASSRAGTTTFDNKSGSSTTPIVREDRNARVDTVINDTKAPKHYTYKTQVPEGARIQRADLSVLVTKDEKMVAGIAPTQAKDAKGKSIPTHYEAKGNVVTQVVDHSDQYAYPIVADPWLNANLFGTLEKDRPGTDRSHGTVFPGKLSAWENSVYRSTLPYRWEQVSSSGTWVITNLGWKKWEDRPVNQNPPRALQRQYTCHAYYGYFVVGAGWHWNIELLHRSNPDWNRYPWSVAKRECNWQWGPSALHVYIGEADVDTLHIR